ncbi:MAG: hypothetical protein WBA97_01390 [Actinophytocola sp.]|uniref:hypothetical protein n=1 Tax=Actinophytocola sp. TaxID=1872138 RepID=UPI003C71C032
MATRLLEELGATLWLARALFVLSQVHEGTGRSDLAAKGAREAARIASAVDSKEAAKLLAQINRVER